MKSFIEQAFRVNVTIFFFITNAAANKLECLSLVDLYLGQIEYF
jgi:hypothetical protein